MGLFNFNSKEKQAESQALAKKLETFLDKLAQRADDLYKEVQATAQEIADTDQDIYKRNYYQFKAGIIAQFTAIVQKGANTFHTQVAPLAGWTEQMTLSALYNSWHAKVLHQMTTLFDSVLERDLEKQYAEAMAEYEQNREKFHCRQCGAKLKLDKFYFIDTYIQCEFCQTQNTFDPGSKAKGIEVFVYPLAELRCHHLKMAHKAIYKEQGADGGLESFRQYAKALVGEMDRILPGLEEQHQDFYNRLIHDYRSYGQSW